ncbi:hypothetical protein RTBOTA2_002964 [Rhodotorula toruloides]|nr:hypothetical protein RTBOTA2_002964 [Rhodotorula toruloides]
MHRTNPVLADARRLQQQRREQQRTYNSHDLLQHGPEDPAKILARIRRMLNDCEQRAQDNALSENALALALLVTAVKVQLAGQDVRQALLLRHPGAADGQSYLDALCDAVTFLHTRVLHDHSLTAHWIKNQENYLVGMMDEAVNNAFGQHSISKHHFKLVRMRAY